MNINERYREREGDLIKLALEGSFDVIAHGCNCQCTMGAGIAPQMAKAFGASIKDRAYHYWMGESTIEFDRAELLGNIGWWKPCKELGIDCPEKLIVVNAYTQLDITGRKAGKRDLDYEALTLCMRKMNHIFKGKHIGLPQIGSHLAGGDWNIIKKIIQDELKDCLVTVVIYKPN